MLFNSYEFLFGFLPAVLAGFYMFGMFRRDWALLWLIAASLLFYAWWRPLNVLLISPSIAINYYICRALLRIREGRPTAARALLIGGIAFNLCFLAYFKYLNFFAGTINDVLGTNLVLTQLILPLGISFITFQKIAFLVDVQAGRVNHFTFRDYSLFVLFFPQLVAGPIVHYREMMPQFHKASCRFNPEDAAIGLSLFFFGLFKKVVFADPLSGYVSPLYEQAIKQGHLTLIDAWVAAVGFTLQIYFDFSGYSDMALGLARFFGVKLPVNFNSPLRAVSIIDFWLRWHVSLTRFLTAYLYNPLVLYLTRQRALKGLPILSKKNTSFSTFATMLMFPTILTMLISGLWHGAGYQYLVWGLMQGFFLTLNHAWRMWQPQSWKQSEAYVRIMRPVGFGLTLILITFAMVMFRAPNVWTAVTIWKGMLGGYGIAIPSEILARLGPLKNLMDALGVRPSMSSASVLATEVVLISFLLVVALRFPNTLQVLAEYEPAIGIKPAKGRELQLARAIWSPTAGWAVGLALVAAAGILSLGQLSEFLYWQF